MMKQALRKLAVGLFASMIAACSSDLPPGGGGGSRLGGSGGSGGSGDNGTAGAGGASTPTGGGGVTGGIQIAVPDAGSQSGSGPHFGNCPDGMQTSLSGMVNDPAGTLPLYNVMLYVPSADLDPIADGPSCDTCAGTASGKPVAAALSDSSGKFVMKDVPDGTDVPLVIQVGKWRREVKIPSVSPCVDNPIDPELTRLPRDQTEGHIPQFALTTGHSDALECLLRKIGVADSEFTTDAGSGRVHMYYGGDLSGPTGDGAGANSFDAPHGGASFASAATLWGDPAKLAKYDIMVLSCEGSQYTSAKKPYLQNMKDYADKGGRIFTDHLHFYWLNHGPDPWPDTANYIGVGSDLPDPFTSLIDQTFPKGMDFASWLVNVGASTTVGQIPIRQGQYSVQSATSPYTQQWIYTDMNPGDSDMHHGVEYMTMNTPAELATTTPEKQCGRVVFTDLHVSAASTGATDVSHPENPFPTGCKSTGELSPQEKALVFMLFDLSSCVQPDKMRPTPPPIMVH